MAEGDAAGRRPPSSPASVEAALRALDSVLGDDENADADRRGGGSLLDSAVGSLLLPSFDARGKFASYERREEGSHLSIQPPSAAPPASPSRSGRGTRGQRHQRRKARSQAKKKEAIDHFITDPSGMHWEDLVELMKKKKEKQKRKKHQSSRQGGQQRNWRSVADVLSTVDESSMEDCRSSPEKTLYTEEMTFVRSLDGSGEGPAAELESQGYSSDEGVPETIDFYPKLSSFYEGDEEDPASSDEEERGAKPTTRYHRPIRKYALGCVALLFLVGVVLGFWGMVSHEHRVARGDGSAVPEGSADLAEEATGDLESLFPFAEELSPLQEYPAAVTKDHSSGDDNSTDTEP
ncbi:hypothetical protein ACHAXT_012792 [Thalassiosira profunda]